MYTPESSQQSVRAGVPELEIRRVEPNGDVPAVRSPADAGDGTGVLVDGHKLRRGSARGVPQVDRVAERNRQHVVAPPVEQVEVVVINEVRSVQSPLRGLGNVAPLFGRLGLQVGGSRVCGDVLGLRRLVPEGEDPRPVVEQLLGEQPPVRLLGRGRRHAHRVLLVPPGLREQIVRHVHVHRRPVRDEPVAVALGRRVMRSRAQGRHVGAGAGLLQRRPRRGGAALLR
uniref:Cell division cycle protein 20 n=1 Tax=Arundo donax TaxID=35708 RepID=A0A0A9E4C3_ARUDO